MKACRHCGQYGLDKFTAPKGQFSTCPECGRKHIFAKLPLLIVCGAPGAGKSTWCRHLAGRLPDVVALEADALWRPEYDKPEDRYRHFFDMWLRLCRRISQSGSPVLLYCAGGTPGNLEPRVGARYFSAIQYLALVCEDDDLRERLRRRPAWRNCGDPAYIEVQVGFNRWLRDVGSNGEPPIELLDTGGGPVQATADRLVAWVREKAGIPH